MKFLKTKGIDPILLLQLIIISQNIKPLKLFKENLNIKTCQILKTVGWSFNIITINAHIWVNITTMTNLGTLGRKKIKSNTTFFR